MDLQAARLKRLRDGDTRMRFGIYLLAGEPWPDALMLLYSKVHGVKARRALTIRYFGYAKRGPQPQQVR